MITRPSTRPQSLLRAVVKQASALPRTQCRSKHTPPTWTDHQKQDRFANNGVPGFLSANAYQETYAKYSQYLCDKLTEYTQGTPDESVQPRDLHFQCSHRPERAALYNHAAMANHTHFFWEALTDSEDPAQRRPGMQTMRNIEMDFESVDHLRSEFLETADAMFGNGFVWLMKPPSAGGMTILATYNAGSPYPEAAPRRDTRDMANFNGRQLADDLKSGVAGRPRVIASGGQTAGSFGQFSANQTNRFTGLLNAQPILCVNVWEHQWIPDYGVLGKRAYLTAWWDCIDWQVVENRLSTVEPDNYGYGGNRRTRNLGSIEAVGRGM
ncbi:hypothetical protein PV05_09699 [Exophiala xenobiotica]|uniref:Manganese/iron superoxide dismutase C-terminal domain-containing protein n=1 Tax=Exophiala xenobiotica TaxID=348802 RepID=A0A0D2CM53_9EURO|nr:uncharacterized protein PV05_09699 [Exophiala xenobiotica]KIW50922.1 hypothetical protein PV05_09699 [Exophiala xenobiotica]